MKTIGASKLLLFAAFGCFLVAALVAGAGLSLGPAVAWFYGGFAAWLLALAV